MIMDSKSISSNQTFPFAKVKNSILDNNWWKKIDFI